MTMRWLSYFSLFIIWVCMSAMCAVGVRVVFGLQGSTIYGSWKAIVLGIAIGSAITLPLAFLMFTGHRMRRKRMWGPMYMCRGCGYDLRGALTASACPECGREITESRRALIRVMLERDVTDADQPTKSRS